jgi:hypothetical protein
VSSIGGANIIRGVSAIRGVSSIRGVSLIRGASARPCRRARNRVAHGAFAGIDGSPWLSLIWQRFHQGDHLSSIVRHIRA